MAQRYGGLDVPQLEQLLSQRSTQQSDLQSELNDANSLAITAQTRPERAQTEISANQTRIQQINAILKNGKDNGKTLSADQRNLLNAELASINALNLLRRQELAGNSQLQDLGNSQHDLLTEKVARQEQEIQDLQTLINDKRRAQSQKRSPTCPWKRRSPAAAACWPPRAPPISSCRTTCCAAPIASTS